MKKAKRRGRPPGSKNKKNKKTGLLSAVKMEVDDLRAYIGNLQSMLAKKINEQKQDLESQLARLTGYGSSNGVTANRASTAKRRTIRAKAKPKYQSKKKPSLKWSGRGMTPVWMREEMKGTKLKKDDFLINA